MLYDPCQVHDFFAVPFLDDFGLYFWKVAMSLHGCSIFIEIINNLVFFLTILVLTRGGCFECIIAQLAVGSKAAFNVRSATKSCCCITTACSTTVSTPDGASLLNVVEVSVNRQFLLGNRMLKTSCYKMAHY